MYEEPLYHWRDPEWRQMVESWVGEKAANSGYEVIGPLTDVRYLPWSAVLRAPTNNGDLYFKACGPSQRHEPALAAFLSRSRPDCMVPVLAAEPDLGWLLTPDGGPTLTTAIRSFHDGFAHWRRILALLAGLQKELIPRTDELLDLAILDRRTSTLPGLYENLLNRPERLLVGEPGALTGQELHRLREITPEVGQCCAELMAFGLPDTFVHDDLHEDHVFCEPATDGRWRYRFFDFGDACLAHPFVQLVSQPRFIPGRFGKEGIIAAGELHEFYLTQWMPFGDIVPLRQALTIALGLGGLIRALTWVNACEDHLPVMPRPLYRAYAERVRYWLLLLAARVEVMEDE